MLTYADVCCLYIYIYRQSEELRDASQLDLPDIEFEPDEGAAASRESGALGMLTYADVC
jgi:hypothetical protein